MGHDPRGYKCPIERKSVIAMAKPNTKFNVVDFVVDYEMGETTEEETTAGFQHLINTGMAWELQGYYGRVAKYLIDGGYCTPPTLTER